MNLILVAIMAIGMPVTAFGLYDLQELLERRAQQQHADD